MEAVQAATGVDFDTEVMAKEKLRLPARMKGGGIKRTTDNMYPTFLGALLDILPRCVDMTETHGEVGHEGDLLGTTYGGDRRKSIRRGRPREYLVSGGYRDWTVSLRNAKGMGRAARRGGGQLRFSGRIPGRGSEEQDGATCGAHTGSDPE
jgi:hypothetical protein